MTAAYTGGKARHQEANSERTLFRYAVVDLATADGIRDAVMRKLPSDKAPLLGRKMPYPLLANGPWILRLSKTLTARGIREEDLVNENWGYFIEADIDIDSLRQTLRRFNLVRLEGRPTPVLFRYWDPRIMKVFLRVSTKQQRRSLFEFIETIKFADGETYSRAEVY